MFSLASISVEPGGKQSTPNSSRFVEELAAYIANHFSYELPGDLLKKIRATWDGTTHTYTSYLYTTARSNQSSPHNHSFSWQTITEPTQYADGLEGEVCTICGATRNTQSLSAYGYALNDYAVPMINAAKAGQTVTFEFGEWNSFPKSFMEKIAVKSKEGVTFVFHYKWNHVKQEITIPAGTPIDLNFDWYGPVKMAELYGAN